MTSVADDLFQWPERGDRDLDRAVNEIIPGLFLGSEAPCADRRMAQACQIRLVVCCNALPEWPPLCRYNGDARPTPHEPVEGGLEAFIAELRSLGPRVDPNDPVTLVYNIPAADTPGFDLSPWFDPTSELLAAALEMTDGPPVKTVVHCQAGVSRSATIVAAYLMRRTGMAYSAILQRLRDRRPVVGPNPGFVNQLQRWDLTGYAPRVGECTAGGVPVSPEDQANQIAARLHDARGKKDEGVVGKLTGYVDALLSLGPYVAVDRSHLGVLATALGRRSVISADDFCKLVVQRSTDRLFDDEAVDMPLLPACAVEMRAALAAGCPALADESRLHADLSAVFLATMTGMGDEFGFFPDPTRTLLWATCTTSCNGNSCSSGLSPLPWMHLFAARVRSVLEAQSAVAFSPQLGITPDMLPFESTEADEWSVALAPHHCRRVLRVALEATVGPLEARLQPASASASAGIRGTTEAWLAPMRVVRAVILAGGAGTEEKEESVDGASIIAAVEKEALDTRTAVDILAALVTVGGFPPSAVPEATEALRAWNADAAAAAASNVQKLLERCHVRDAASIAATVFDPATS